MKIQSAMLLMTLAVAADAHAGAVIVNKSSDFPAMDLETAKRIFLGREPTVGGQNVTVIYQGEGPTRSDFESKVLAKTGSDLTAYWSKLIFTGKAAPPLEAGGDDGVKAMVLRIGGSVGYVNDNSVDSSVKVLFHF